jgi:hypothetical protein
MKTRFYTLKFTRVRDLFNFGFLRDNEADLNVYVSLFGREYSWSFFKKDSKWMSYYYEDFE